MRSANHYQCPLCGTKVVEVNTMVGWGVICPVCDYATADDHKTRYEARIAYREDFNREFKKGVALVDTEVWQEKLDKGEI